MRIINRRHTAIAALSLAAGCLGETAAFLPTEPASNALHQLAVTPPAAIMAVGTTQQLSVAATALDGSPVATVDSVVYSLANPADTLRARVSALGLVTALATTTSPVVVNAAAYRNQTAAGSAALIQVTAAAVSGLTMSVQPVAPDSAKLAAGITKTIVPVVRNPGTLQSVANPAIRITVRPADFARMRVYRPCVRLPGTGNSSGINCVPGTAAGGSIMPTATTGTVWLFAEVNAYGTVLKDSVEYTLSNPFTVTVAAVKHQLALTADGVANHAVRLAPFATVTFQNSTVAGDQISMTYTFDNPAAATAATPASTIGGASGNVTTLTAGQTSRRQFLTPGTYRWTMNATGGLAPWSGQSLTGTIVIE